MIRCIRSWAEGLTAFKALLVVSVAAFMTRLLPLSISQYPFNNDTLTESSLATQILESGHLHTSANTSWYGTHSGATPVLNVFLAFMSSVFGISPNECAQLLAAIVAILTVGSLFLLGRLVSGSLRGGIATSFAAILMGTFVFVTGSAWKEMLGVSLFVFVLLTYVWRDRLEYRVLSLAILIVLPLVHHLVALVVLLIFAYLLSWSWFYAFAGGRPRRRHVEDLVLVAIPVVWAVTYYSLVSFDRISLVSSPIMLLLFGVSLVVASALAIFVLSIKNHSKWTFAPLAGLGLFLVITLDYYGFLFPYSTSATELYIVLAVSSGLLFGLAWYGTEVILEHKPLHRAIQIALIISPMSILGFGVINVISSASHQIIYRTFDFADVFVFLGIGTAIAWLYEKRRKAYLPIGLCTIALLLASFPFAYQTDELLGVRHDTQAYEMDAIRWLTEGVDSPFLESDERLGHIAEAAFGVPKHPNLPGALIRNTTTTTLPVESIFLMEDSWVKSGVNDFPYGKVVVPMDNYTWALRSADVLYIGGPSTDRVVLFRY